MKAFKTISAIALAALVLAGCEKKELEFTPSPLIKIGEEITITATGEVNPTKTVLQEDGKSIFWGVDDKITVIYGANSGEFVSENTAPAATAEFSGTLTAVLGTSETDPSTAADTKYIYGIYPHNVANAVDATGKVTVFLPKVQKAAAGTYDPEAFPAIARSEGLNLAFYNVAGALAITVAEDNVNKIIVSNNNDSAAPLAGKLEVRILDNNHPEVDAVIDTEKEIELIPATGETFENGKTYVLALLPFKYVGGITVTLKHTSGDDTVLSKTDDVTIERNKIYPMTVKAKVLALKKVWGHHGVAGTAGWTAYVDGVESFEGDGGYIRNATMDDEFVYVPKCQGTSADGNNFDEVKIYKFSMSDGTYAGLVQRTVDPDYMAGKWQGVWPVACLRVLKNTDSSVNGGKDILVATNLIDGGTLRAYAWNNGVNNQPARIANFENWRRMGDRITVSGTYQSGRIYYISAMSASPMVAWLTVTNGTTPSYGFDALGEVSGGGDGGDSASINEYYPFGAFGLIATNTGTGLRLVSGTTVTQTYVDYKRCFGWNAFSFNGKDYLSYLNMAGGTNKPIVTVIEGSSDTLEHLQATLEAKKVVAQAGIATADPLDLSTTTTYAGNNQGDSSLRIIDGVPYILGMARGGMALFKLVLE